MLVIAKITKFLTPEASCDMRYEPWAIQKALELRIRILGHWVTPPLYLSYEYAICWCL